MLFTRVLLTVRAGKNFNKGFWKEMKIKQDIVPHNSQTHVNGGNCHSLSFKYFKSHNVSFCAKVWPRGGPDHTHFLHVDTNACISRAIPAPAPLNLSTKEPNWLCLVHKWFFFLRCRLRLIVLHFIHRRKKSRLQNSNVKCMYNFFSRTPYCCH